MIIIITGLSGSGKTAILKNANLPNTYFSDDYVKDVLYKKGTDLYEIIKKTFGSNFVNDKSVDVTKLGQLVFGNYEKLKELNQLVKPFIREWLNNLEGNSIVEMGAYINYESEYKDLVDKVIFIKKDEPILDHKFTYMDSKKQPIYNKNINFDYLIENNKTIIDASNELVRIVKSVFK